jgi:hypothetical protein
LCTFIQIFGEILFQTGPVCTSWALSRDVAPRKRRRPAAAPDRAALRPPVRRRASVYVLLRAFSMQLLAPETHAR